MVSAATVQLYVVWGLSDVIIMDSATDVRMCISPVSNATSVIS